jgi:hypothetical protein
MKSMKLLFITAVLLSACMPTAPLTSTKYHVPQGYTQNDICHSNWDCHHGTYCGFVGVDTFPVCRAY